MAPENSERGGHLSTIFYSFWRIIKNSTKFHRKRGGHSRSGQSLKICPSDCRCHPSLKRIKQHLRRNINTQQSTQFCFLCLLWQVYSPVFLWLCIFNWFATPILNSSWQGQKKQITGLDSKLALINNVWLNFENNADLHTFIKVCSFWNCFKHNPKFLIYMNLCVSCMNQLYKQHTFYNLINIIIDRWTSI